MARITSHSRAETIIVDVYHLHGGTGRFTVWESGKQNSRLASFVPESRLPFAVTFIERRPRRSETGIKDGFQEMEHEFSFGTFRSGKQDYFFRRSAAPGNFPPKRPET